ncbi:MAG: DJ-1/PfpI family protein [Paludibacteraceae bacterium]|nr:DJ-1/PfpI family protein [Paludibacteraceae bacterium]
MNYLFLSTGFEEIEALTTVDLLRRAKIDVTTVSCEEGQMVMGSHHIQVEADKHYKDCDFRDAEMLILPGGSRRLGEFPWLGDLLKKHNAENKMIAAICAAPSVLGDLGILEGKQATCYPGFESYLGDAYIGGLVVESKNIITAKGPGLSADFAFCIIEHLAGTEVADAVYEAAQY